jgi:translocator protein
MELAFVVIVLLWITIIKTMYEFWGVNRVSTLLLVPYLAWVSFASVLNFSLAQLN